MPSGPVATNLLVALAVAGVLVGALAGQSVAVRRGLLPAGASRKVGHVGLGSALLVSWLLYVPHDGARWIAAAPTLLLAGLFLALGAGVLRNDTVVSAVARSRERSELLTGPALYALAFAAITVLFWRERPEGMVALAVLVVGDGMAEVVGKSVRSPSLPWNRSKTWAGTWAAVVAGFVAALATLQLFHVVGHLQPEALQWWRPALGVALAGALVESLPWGDWDNVAVALASAGVALLLF